MGVGLWAEGGHKMLLLCLLLQATFHATQGCAVFVRVNDDSVEAFVVLKLDVFVAS